MFDYFQHYFSCLEAKAKEEQKQGNYHIYTLTVDHNLKYTVYFYKNCTTNT